MTAQVVDVEISMTGASPAAATAMGELLRSLGEDAGEWKYVHRPRQSGIPVACDGSGTCIASPHIHGCFADFGDCDDASEHVCGCGTCVAIESDRQARAARGEL